MCHGGDHSKTSSFIAKTVRVCFAEAIPRRADPCGSNRFQFQPNFNVRIFTYLIDRTGCVTMFSGSGRNNTQPRSPASFAPAAASFGAGGAAQTLG